VIIRTFGFLALSVIVADSALFAPPMSADTLINSEINCKPAIHNTLSKQVVIKRKPKVAKSTQDESIDTLISELPDDSKDEYFDQAKAPLQGTINYVDLSPQFSDTIHRLTKEALQKEPNFAKAEKAVDHFRTKLQRTITFTKDTVNYAYPYRGFSMSMEGSRVIVDKNQKLSNLWISELCKQRYWDEMHPKVIAQIMQIAMGLGIENPEESNVAVQKGVKGLSALVGDETAQTVVSELSDWKNQLIVPDAAFKQPTWDCEMSQKVYQNALKTSADGDALIHYVYTRVKKFDHGKLANIAAGVVEANLSAVAVLSGNPFASLAAEGLNTAFVMSTGGPEENKILKELYFGRRLEIRRKRISDETQLAISNYEKALLTHNSPQLAMSEVVLAELVGPDRIATILERDPINDFTTTAPIVLAQKAQ